MPEILPEGESFLYDGKGDAGCLLLHGFTGAPQEMLELGRFLADNGITSLCRRLPGHATTWQDLAATGWRDWFAEAESGLEELRKRCSAIFATGLSMGALQTLHLATHHNDLKGIVAMAAPIFFTDWKAKWLAPIFRWAPMRRLVPSFALPLSDMLDRERAKERIHYARLAPGCILELLDYMQHMEPDLEQIRQPALFLQARRDHVVPPENAPYIMSRVSSKDKELVWIENSLHVMTEDLDKRKVFDLTLNFIKKRLD